MSTHFKAASVACVLIIGLAGAASSAVPESGFAKTRVEAAIKADRVYYRCGRYRCRHVYRGYSYYRPYYYRPYYRPYGGFGLGGVHVGIF